MCPGSYIRPEPGERGPECPVCHRPFTSMGRTARGRKVWQDGLPHHDAPTERP
jgi:hypothetical protein